MISEYLKKIFLFDSNDYLQLFFNSLYFWVFFGIVMGIYSIIYRKKGARNIYLFLISLFFYYKISGYFFILLLFSTFVDYFLGIGIYHSKKQIHKTIQVVLSISINLLVLVYFKYAYFFTDSFNAAFGTGMDLSNHLGHWFYGINDYAYPHDPARWLPPIGISFFTFQTISYSVDIYKGKLKPVYNILDFGFYVSYFPQLVMGPIVRASHFIPQLYQDYRLRPYEFGLALYWILKGLAKKVILADFLAYYFIDTVFSDPLRNTGFENLMAVVGYSMQVYADFSGYTDIAIGIALLMGFRLNTNFNSPYKAKNVGEFWQRWHISLSTWLKDYLYIPLGGNRTGSYASYILIAIIMAIIVLISGYPPLAFYFLALIVILGVLGYFLPTVKKSINTNINLMITMLLGGLWHGASWNFLIWGGLNGLGLVVYKFWRKISPWERYNNWITIAWKVLVTFTFITFTRIFFRSENIDIAKNMMYQIWNNFSPEVIPAVVSANYPFFVTLLIGFIIHWLPDSIKDQFKRTFIRSHVLIKILACVITVFVVYQYMKGGVRSFIYFQF